jgi:hypothetical protein
MRCTKGNPKHAPTKAVQKITSSPRLGMYIIFKYELKSTRPDKYAKMASVNPMMAEVPAARPSMPSVIFAPLETAVMITITTSVKTIHV